LGKPIELGNYSYHTDILMTHAIFLLICSGIYSYHLLHFGDVPSLKFSIIEVF